MKSLLAQRTAMEGDMTYTVYLRDESGVAEPVETSRIDYYDSGLWVHVDGGRDFYPYDRIEVIEEREAAPAAATAEAGAEASGEATEIEEADGEEYVDLEGTIDEEEGEADEGDAPEEDEE